MKFEIINNNNILKLTESTELELKQLKIFLNRRIKNWNFHPLVKKRVWDGYISYFHNDKFVPFGLWGAILEMGKEYGYPVQIEGLKQTFDLDIDFEEFRGWCESKIKENGNFEIRDYQLETAFKILKYKRCIGELATSAGKSFILYLVISYLLEKKNYKKILVIVPTVDLVLQMAEDFYEYNLKNKELELNIQKIYADNKKERKNANIVISTYQSLSRKKSAFFSQFDAVCVDEVHKAKTNSIKSILEKCLHMDRRFGVTGTFPDKQSLDYLTICAYLGPVISKVNADYLIKQGYITPCVVKIIEIDYLTGEQKQGMEALKRIHDQKKAFEIEKKLVIENDLRLQFLVSLASKLKGNTLILFHRINYGTKIYNTLRQKTNKQVYYISGEVESDIREQYKKLMEDGNDKIMVASFGTFSTGINIKNIHNIVFTESFKSDVIIRQSIGRGLRKHKSKNQLTIYDIVDDFRTNENDFNHLYRHSMHRRKIYKQENFPFEVLKLNLSKLKKTK